MKKLFDYKNSVEKVISYNNLLFTGGKDKCIRYWGQ